MHSKMHTGKRKMHAYFLTHFLMQVFKVPFHLCVTIWISKHGFSNENYKKIFKKCNESYICFICKINDLCLGPFSMDLHTTHTHTHNLQNITSKYTRKFLFE